MIADLAKEMSDQVQATKSIDVAALLTLRRIVDKSERALAELGADGALNGEILVPGE